jgi:hypothetical protein
MVIFHSYVNLPEGMVGYGWVWLNWLRVALMLDSVGFLLSC